MNATNNPAHTFGSSVRGGGRRFRQLVQRTPTIQVVEILRARFPKLKGSDSQIGEMVETVRDVVRVQRVTELKVESHVYPPVQPDW